MTDTPPTNLAERLPPQNLEAERSVLGSILLANETLDEVSGLLQTEKFYGDAHRRIYAAVQQLHDGGIRGIDTVTLGEALGRRGELEEIGGVPYLAGLVEAVPHPGHARHYAGIVCEKAMRRSLIYACTNIIRKSYETGTPTDELLAEAERLLFEITESQLHSDRPDHDTSLSSALTDAFDEINSRAEGTSGRLLTGFGDIDEMLSGFKAGQFGILAARPSVGKTALATNIAHNITARDSSPVLFISLEQSRGELAERLMIAESGVSETNIAAGRLSEYEMSSLGETSNRLACEPLHIADDAGLTATQIASIARVHKRKYDIKMLVVDYLQLVEADNPRETREQQVAGIGRRMKRLGRELQIPVLCLAQLNRKVEESSKRPRMSSLRESGALEQDADVVMLLHRPSAADPGDRPGEAELILEKNRNGRTGIVRLVWDGPRMQFLDAAHAYQDAGCF